MEPLSNEDFFFLLQSPVKVQMVAQLNNKSRPESAVVVRSKKIRRRKSQASPKHSYRHANSVRTYSVFVAFF